MAITAQPGVEVVHGDEQDVHFPGRLGGAGGRLGENRQNQRETDGESFHGGALLMRGRSGILIWTHGKLSGMIPP
jgi:hypothetical protein